MAYSNSAISPSSTGKMLTGNFSVLENLEHFMDNLNSHVDNSLSDALGYARADLRKSALDHPDWMPYADNLTVHHRGGEFVYGMSGSPEKVQAMNDLEYGSQAGDPKPLLRLKAHRYNAEMVDRLKVKVPR